MWPWSHQVWRGGGQLPHNHCQWQLGGCIHGSQVLTSRWWCWSWWWWWGVDLHLIHINILQVSISYVLTTSRFDGTHIFFLHFAILYFVILYFARHVYDFTMEIWWHQIDPRYQGLHHGWHQDPAGTAGGRFINLGLGDVKYFGLIKCQISWIGDIKYWDIKCQISWTWRYQISWTWRHDMHFGAAIIVSRKYQHREMV